MRTSRLLTRVLIGEVILFAAIGLGTSGVAAYTLTTRLTSEFASKGTAIATSIANASDELILTRDASTIQSLVDHKLLHKFNYLSTVSGGGYIGSWLSAWLYHTKNADTVIRHLGSQRQDSDFEPPPLEHLPGCLHSVDPSEAFTA